MKTPIKSIVGESIVDSQAAEPPIISGMCECVLHVAGHEPVKFTGKISFEPLVEREEWAFAE